ncbi:MAG: nitrogenase component 1 [Deltaproteobacteria bacterium]|jgi:hypothetical protein|nr:nitrogenase component 1 [Deltaproteobacteria bacterium]
MTELAISETVFTERWAKIRERRTGALCAWHGRLSDLMAVLEQDEPRQTIRTFAQAGLDDVLAAVKALGHIKDAGLIIHGGEGCAAGASALIKQFDQKDSATKLYSTALSENDSILGGEEPLAEAVSRARAQGAKRVIFILRTPMTAINNDDVASVIHQHYEHGSKLVYVPVDGLRSKTALSGLDSLSHACLSDLIEGPGESERIANGRLESERLVNARIDKLLLVSMSESAEDIAEIIESLKSLGINVCSAPRFSSSETFIDSGRYRAALALNAEEGEYLVQGLAHNFGVKALSSLAPVGLRATDAFLQAALLVMTGEADGEAPTGLDSTFDSNLDSTAASPLDLTLGSAKALERVPGRSEAMQAVIAAPGRGIRAFLSGSLPVVASLAEAVKDLGGSVVGAAFPIAEAQSLTDLSRLAEASSDSLTVCVGNEPFEIANILFKNPADVLIGGAGFGRLARDLGALHLSTARRSFYGYRGLSALAEALDFAKKLPKSVSTSRLYQASWLNKPGNWHIKLETL